MISNEGLAPRSRPPPPRPPHPSTPPFNQAKDILRATWCIFGKWGHLRLFLRNGKALRCDGFLRGQEERVKVRAGVCPYHLRCGVWREGRHGGRHVGGHGGVGRRARRCCRDACMHRAGSHVCVTDATRPVSLSHILS
jgi:hypothetical protein